MTPLAGRTTTDASNLLKSNHKLTKHHMSASLVPLDRTGYNNFQRHPLLMNADIPDDPFRSVQQSGPNEESWVSRDKVGHHARAHSIDDEVNVGLLYEDDTSTKQRPLVQAPYGSLRQLRDFKGVQPVPVGQRGAHHGLLLVNDNTRNHFGRRVFLDEKGLPKYM